MAEENKQPIVIKRIKKGGHGHHGGAWKIAYADFMTAMMAFFLLMWLVSSSSDEQLAGIAEYFAPSSASKEQSGAGGMLGGRVIGEGSKTSNMSNVVSPNISLPPSMSPMGTGGGDGYDKPSDIEAKAKELLAKKEEEAFKKAKGAMEKALAGVPDLKGLSQSLKVDNTPDGLRIQLIDQKDIPMFPLGSNILNPSALKLLKVVSKVIKRLPNKISIEGHTDAIQFNGKDGYTNWELSADRSLVTMRQLIRDGVSPHKVLKIVGFEDNQLYVKDDPNHPNNRRISIILLREHPAFGSSSEVKEKDKKSKPKRKKRHRPVNPFTKK
jgi:chemotaxis protein MotB